MLRFYKSLKNQVFGKLGAIEIALLGIAVAVIELQFQDVLWESIATAVVVVGFYAFHQNKSASLDSNLLYKCAGISIIALSFLTLFSDPSHAVLLKLDTAVRTHLSTIQPPALGTFLVNTIIALLWIGRLVLVGILIQMGLKINESRGQEKSFKELFQDPAIFIISIGVVDRIGNFIITGALQ